MVGEIGMMGTFPPRRCSPVPAQPPGPGRPGRCRARASTGLRACAPRESPSAAAETSVSGEGSKVSSSTSTTLPTSSASRHTVPPAARTTRQTGVRLAGRSGSSSCRRSSSTITTCPRRFINPLTDRRGQWNRTQLAVGDHFLNLLRLHSKQQLIQVERAELTGVCHKLRSQFFRYLVLAPRY